MPELSPDCSKRDCSLPHGCKDLVDVLNASKRQKEAWNGVVAKTVPLPIHLNEGFAIEIKPATTVRDLAEVLQVTPSGIIATLMKLGVFVNMDQVIDFDSAARLLSKYGYLATKPA